MYDDQIKEALLPLFASRNFCEQTAEAMADQVVSEVGRTLEEITHVVIPVEASDGLLASMALRFDHSFGMDKQDNGFMKCGYTPEEREVLMSRMKQVHEEVTGAGFYQPEREAWYLRMAKIEAGASQED